MAEQFFNSPTSADHSVKVQVEASETSSRGLTDPWLIRRCSALGLTPQKAEALHPGPSVLERKQRDEVFRKHFAPILGIQFPQPTFVRTGGDFNKASTARVPLSQPNVIVSEGRAERLRW